MDRKIDRNLSFPLRKAVSNECDWHQISIGSVTCDFRNPFTEWPSLCFFITFSRIRGMGNLNKIYPVEVHRPRKKLEL